MESAQSFSHTNTATARFTIGMLAVHIIGMSFLVILPASASAATLGQLTAAIDAEYHMADGTRTTLMLDESGYTTISWSFYMTAISTAQTIERGGVHLQSLLSWAIDNLQRRKSGLVPVDDEGSDPAVDTSALDDLINAEYSDRAGRTTLLLTQSEYTPDSWVTYTDALTAAQSIAGNDTVTQAEVDAAAIALLQAKAALVARILTTTTTMISSSHNPSVFGQSVTFTATVSPADATGSVSFAVGTMLPVTATVSNGSGSITIDSLSVGPHTIVATYGGNDSYAGSPSDPLTQTVQAEQSNGSNGSGTGGGSVSTGGSSGGRRGAGTLSAVPFQAEDIAPPAFGGPTSDLSNLRRSQVITFCRVQSRLSAISEGVLGRHAERLAKHWGWTAARVLAGFREESLCR